MKTSKQVYKLRLGLNRDPITKETPIPILQVKGVFSKPSGKYIVAPNFCLLS